MHQVTFIAPITLASGVSEKELLAASDRFQTGFVDHQPGVLRRELVKKSEGRYVDIVLFRSIEDANDVMAREQESKLCAEFFALMDMSDAATQEMGPYVSLAVYERKPR
ncbi:MAG: hypothetical protein OXR73_09520 [Myxococcales bacterium]|nr:hypothetical protein [Myxococcales bacterium]